MRAKPSLVSTALLLAALVPGCGYYLIPDRFQPVQVDQQKAAGAATRMEVYDDGTVTFFQNRLEVSVRPVTDEELNRQFSSLSGDGGGAADELPTNAFTYGNWKDPRTGEPPQRFSVFKISVKNYEYPKVKLDPLRTVIRSSNGRSYYPWGQFDFVEYFRRFALAYSGLGYRHFSERRDMIKLSRYPNDEFCFSGQTKEGYTVFPKIHEDVADIAFVIRSLGIRYNFRNEAMETMDLEFRFKRQLHRVRNYGAVAKQQ